MEEDNKLVEERREKLRALRAQGQAFPNDWRPAHQALELAKRYGGLDKAGLEKENATVRIAGRMMLKRVMGKASFATLQDATGRLQVYVANDVAGEAAHEAFKHWDLGDIVGVEGVLFKTNKGELTVNAELMFEYRHSALPEDWICLGARLAGVAGEPAEIDARMKVIQDQRADSQPIRSRTGGSTFKNPPGHKAWQLIDAAGCRGLTLGGAMVSDKHCNFLINTGTATAADLENLGEEVRRRVKAGSGIELEWEIKRLGRTAASGGAA